MTQKSGKEYVDYKTLYVDDKHHMLVRKIAFHLNISLRETVERLIRAEEEVVGVAKEMR